MTTVGVAIPESAYPRCMDCDQPFDPTHRLTLREVVGFCRSRDAGGQNHVIGRVETGRMVCPACAPKRQRGIDPGQGTLL